MKERGSKPSVIAKARKAVSSIQQKDHEDAGMYVARMQRLWSEVPAVEVGAVLDQLRSPSSAESVDLAAIDKVHIPTGQGHFMRKNNQQYPKIQKRGIHGT